MNPTNEQLFQRTEDLRRRLETIQRDLQQLSVDFCKHHEEVQDLVKQQGEKKPPRLRPVTTPERRTTQRRRGNPISVLIQHVNAGAEAFEGWVVDRSTGGVRLLVDDPLTPGTILHVRPSKAPPTFPWIELRVKNCFSERMSWNV